MEKQSPKFPDNARVRLKDGVHPSFYGGLGLAGNEGWIRKHKTEKYGFQQVYVEWDKDHWAFNGTEDGWTWENHFELVEDKSMSEDKKDPANELSEQIAAAVGGPIADIIGNYLKQNAPKAEPVEETKLTAPPKVEGKITVKGEEPIEDEEELSNDLFGYLDDEDDEAPYEDTLKKAIESAEGSEAFVMITISKEAIEGLGPHKQIAMPMVFHNAKNMESSLLTHLYMSQLSGDFMIRLVSDRMRVEKALDEAEEDDD